MGPVMLSGGGGCVLSGQFCGVRSVGWVTPVCWLMWLTFSWSEILELGCLSARLPDGSTWCHNRVAIDV
jgi:hypothetical protein